MFFLACAPWVFVPVCARGLVSSVRAPWVALVLCALRELCFLRSALLGLCCVFGVRSGVWCSLCVCVVCVLVCLVQRACVIQNRMVIAKVFARHASHQAKLAHIVDGCVLYTVLVL